MADNVERIAKHIEEISNILEIPINDNTKDTPKRVSKMLVNEFFRNVNNKNIEELNASMKVFPNDYDNNMIVIRDIPFSSVCEHHWVPFSGKCSIGYIPDRKVLGLSKFPRVVKYFSKKPQLQEQLTEEIFSYLYDLLYPHCLIVEMRAEHGCVKCRGIESDCETVTLKKFASKDDMKMFYKMVR